MRERSWQLVVAPADAKRRPSRPGLTCRPLHRLAEEEERQPVGFDREAVAKTVLEHDAGRPFQLHGVEQPGGRTTIESRACSNRICRVEWRREGDHPAPEAADLPLDGPRETRSHGEAGRPKPATGCCALVGPTNLERLSMSDRPGLPAAPSVTLGQGV